MKRFLPFFLLVWATFAQGASHLIVAGAGGDDTYREKFNGWAERLERVLIEKLKQDQDRVYLLQENPRTEDDHRRIASLENLQSVVQTLAESHNADEPMFVYLLGHGSHLRDETRFHLPGSDLSLNVFAELIAKVSAKPLVVIHSAPASAGLVNVMSGEQRVLIAATKNVREQNATEFMEYFLQGLEQDIADRNRDQRISVWEASLQAATLTAGFYTSESLIATEHAILDDNGDGLGTRLLLEEVEQKHMVEKFGKDVLDGRLARTTYLKNFQFPPEVPREWVDQYLGIMEEVETLKAKKETLSESVFYQRLEARLLEAAKIHQRIRTKLKP